MRLRESSPTRQMTVSVRKSRGRDIRAACGQLIVEGGPARRAPAQALAAALGMTPRAAGDRAPSLLAVLAVVRPAGVRGRAADAAGAARQIDGIVRSGGAERPPSKRFLATRGGNPVVEQNARLVFFVQRRRTGTHAAHRRRLQRLGDDAAGLRRRRPARRRASPARRGRISRARRSRTRGSNTCLLFEKETTADPRNPRTVRTFTGPRSEIRMPFFTGQPEVDGRPPRRRPGARGGSFTSRALKGTRRIWTYLPPGYDAATGPLSHGLFPRRRQLRRLDGRARRARPADCGQVDSAGHRGVRRAGHPPGGVLAQPGVARVRRRPSSCRPSTRGCARSRRRTSG